VTVDVPHLQRRELAPTQPRAIERHEHRAVVEVLRSGNEPPHFIRTQNGGETSVLFRRWQVVFHGPALEHAYIDKAQRGDMERGCICGGRIATYCADRRRGVVYERAVRDADWSELSYWHRARQ
jgi:hypothetical protein